MHRRNSGNERLDMGQVHGAESFSVAPPAPLNSFFDRSLHMERGMSVKVL